MLRGVSPVMRIALALVLTGSAAACPSAPPPPVHTPIPVAPSTVEPVTSASAAPSSSASAAPKTATLLSDPDGRLDDFVAGPPGTLLVGGRGKSGAFVASIDLVKRTPVARVKLADTEARTLLAREGDRVYALVDDEDAKDWFEIGPNLSVTHLARLSSAGGKKKKALWSDLTIAFTVVDGRPIVLPKASYAVAFVFSPKGELVATRDCKANLFWPKYYQFALRGGRVLLSDLYHEDGSTGACAFDADGKGSVDTLKIPAGQFFHLGESALAITGMDAEDEWSAPVDLHLKVGKKVKPPEVPDVADTASRCAGAKGSAVRRSAFVHGTKIVHTFNCCGDSGPAGIWVCP